jgi:serine/threonine protein kinase
VTVADGIALTPLYPHDPRAVGPYRLSGRLGQGGQGVVYLGEQESDPPAGVRYAAVKVVGIDVRDDPRAKERFVREIAAARRVASFCTASILAADVSGDLPYVASEYISGPTLHRRVLHSGPITGTELDRLAIGTATALAAIHRADVVHCDLKPANVILGPDGPRVIDFGIAQAIDGTKTSTIQGTPAYMAPERFEVGPARGPSDLFAWAATIAFAATGRPPFGGESMMAIMRAVVEDQPDLHGVPRHLDGLLRECLRKDPRERPTARDVLLRLLGYAQEEATVALEPVLRQGRDAADAPAVPAQRAKKKKKKETKPAQTRTIEPPPRRTWGHRVRRHWRDGPAVTLAIGAGLAGAAVGYLAMPALLPALGLGTAALLAAWTVRTAVAAALD